MELRDGEGKWWASGEIPFCARRLPLDAPGLSGKPGYNGPNGQFHHINTGIVVEFPVPYRRLRRCSCFQHFGVQKGSDMRKVFAVLLGIFGIAALFAEEYGPGIILLLIAFWLFRSKSKKDAPKNAPLQKEAAATVSPGAQPMSSPTPSRTAGNVYTTLMATVRSPYTDELISSLQKYADDLRSLNRDFTAILLGSGYEWREFEQWHGWFDQANYFPPAWSSLHAGREPLPEEAAEALGKFNTLSIDAKLLLVGNNAVTTAGPITIPLDDAGRQVGFLPEKVKHIIVTELAPAGIGDYPIPAAERLALLRVQELRELCDELDIPKSGNKVDLVRRIAESAPDDFINSVLPPEAHRDMGRFGFSLSLRARNAIKAEINVIQLLASTLQSRLATLNRLEEYRKSDVSKVTIYGASDNPCPICKDHNGKEVAIASAGPNVLPPFHPGCRCRISPTYEYTITI